ncbi:MAG TPA: lipoyl(octanoyl) transferase LipB [Bacteroidia bacterium]|nr:lipoyl(octanoyl) transferase LipB [Bacteroidia bacterium]
MQQIQYIDWGLIDYKEAWEQQEQLMQNIIAIKMHNRNLENAAHEILPHKFIMCEHPHVYTLGKSGSEKNLLRTTDELEKIDASFYKINRGGDITYHGPGQLVGYPILDLDCFFNDIHKYMRCLEEVIILTLKNYNIIGTRIAGLTGVWLQAGGGKPERKICAMGVRLSRWVTMHGFALNANNDLSYFNNIIPCGIDDKAVTSIMEETGESVDIEKLKKQILQNFANVFEAEITLA